MEQANEVLEGITRNVREITRLMAISSANKDRCLIKIDESMAHLDSIRRVVDVHRVNAVEDSLRALRSEVCATQDTTDGAPAAHSCYTAERPLSGKKFTLCL